MPPRVLLIEDEPSLGAALEIALRRIGCVVVPATGGRAALDRLAAGSWDAVVLDIGLPDISGLEVLAALRRRHPALPVLVITAHGHLDNAIAARKAGATDYMVKPLDLTQFQQAVTALLEAVRAPQPRQAPHDSTPEAAPLFVGGAPCLQRAFAAIARACAGHSPVLVTGPSGSGKSLVAAIIHRRSPRAAAPCTTVEAAALADPRDLADALAAHPDGTVVVEELPALAPPLQAALTDLLREPGPRARFIATASADLREAIRRGAFREDLFYLLSPGEVPLPPLAERTSDIPALCAALAPSGPLGPPEFTASALAALKSWSWPGNVRELRGVLAWACDAARGAPVLRSHLPPHLAEATPRAPHAELDAALAAWLADPAVAALTWDSLTTALESRLLALLLPRFDDKPTRLAAALDIHRSTLRQKLARAAMLAGVTPSGA